MMIRLALIAAILTLVSGCASAPAEEAQATHYWESSATARQYRTDNRACEQASLVDAEGELDPDSDAYESYRNCMIEQGYTLRSYR